MPYYTKYKVYRKRKDEKLGGSIGFIPQLSILEQRMVDLSKYQFNTQVFEYKSSFIPSDSTRWCYVRTNPSGQCKFASCPLFNFVNSDDFVKVKGLFREYRLVKVKISVFMGSIEGAFNNAIFGDTILTNVSEHYNRSHSYVMMATGWILQGQYDNVIPVLTFNEVISNPTSKFKGFSSYEVPQMKSSFVSEAGQTWLSTDVDPESGQNLGKESFCPNFYCDFQFTLTGVEVGLFAVEEYTVECRSPKL